MKKPQHIFLLPLAIIIILAGFFTLRDQIFVAGNLEAASIRFKKSTDAEWQTFNPEAQALKTELRALDKDIKGEKTLFEKATLLVSKEARKVEDTKDVASLTKERDEKLRKLALESPKEAISYIERESPKDLEKVSLSDEVAYVTLVEEIDEKTNEYKTSYVLYSPEKDIEIYSEAKPQTPTVRLTSLEGYQTGKTIFAESLEIAEIEGGAMPGVAQGGGNEYKVLVIMADFLDSENSDDFTLVDAENWFNGYPFRDFFYEQSYGNMDIVADVHGWVTMPVNGTGSGCNAFRSDYTGNSVSLSNSYLIDYLHSENISFIDYDHMLLILDCPDGNWGGAAGNTDLDGEFLPSAFVRGVSSDGPSLHFVAHEMGHYLYGDYYPHANAIDCGSRQYQLNYYQDSLLDCDSVEYGNFYDAMGSWQAFSHHFRASFKRVLGWFTQDEILDVNETGTYTIYPLEGQVQGAKYLRIGTDFTNGPLYSIEYRQNIGFDSNLVSPNLVQNLNGVFVYRDSHTGLSSLLDMSPSQLSWTDDAENVTLKVNETFFDDNLPIAISVLSAEANQATVYIDIGQCQREAPATVFNTYPPWQVVPGPGEAERVPIYYHVANPDGYTCGSSEFTFTFESSHPEITISPAPQYNSNGFAGFRYWNTLHPVDPVPLITEIPAAISYIADYDTNFYAEVIVPEGISPGEYPVYFTFINLNSGLETTEEYIITVD